MAYNQQKNSIVSKNLLSEANECLLENPWISTSKKKKGRGSIALKMKREPSFPHRLSLSLSFSSRFLYPSAKKTSPRSIFNPAAKLFNRESFRRYTNQARKLGALAMHDISLDRILDRWSLVGTDVVWRSPDGETWVGGWPPAKRGKRKKLCETAKAALQSWDAP